MLSRLIPVRETFLAGAILLLLALIASRFSGFVAPTNLANVFNDTAPLIILALGQMVVILTRCIDLSVAANLALTGMAVAMLNVAMPGPADPGHHRHCDYCSVRRWGRSTVCWCGNCRSRPSW